MNKSDQDNQTKKIPQDPYIKIKEKPDWNNNFQMVVGNYGIVFPDKQDGQIKIYGKNEVNLSKIDITKVCMIPFDIDSIDEIAKTENNKLILDQFEFIKRPENPESDIDDEKYNLFYAVSYSKYVWFFSYLDDAIHFFEILTSLNLAKIVAKINSQRENQRNINETKQDS